MPIASNKSIILFDGVCNLCNASVQFLLKHDRKEQFLFCSLQSDAAEKLLLQFNFKKIDTPSIILIEDDHLYEKSTAVLRIFKNLDSIWSTLHFFVIIPLRIRDYMYETIAKNRYKWFGKNDSCLLPNEEYKNRFI